MPVSEPSYFPPQKSVDRIVGLNAGTKQLGNHVFLAGEFAGRYMNNSDVILIGTHVLSSNTAIAPLTDTNGNNSVIIGSQSGVVATSFTDTETGSAGPAVIVGGNSVPSHPALPNIIVVGCGVLANDVPQGGSGDSSDIIAVGNNILLASIGSVMYNDVIIGHKIAQDLVTGTQTIHDSVLLGHAILATLTASCEVTNDVIIGAGACPSFNGTQSVYVGQGSGATSSASSSDNVVLGFQADDESVAQCVILGSQAKGGAQSSITIGYKAECKDQTAIVIGTNAKITAADGSATGTVLIGQSATSLGNSPDRIIIGSGASVTGIGQNGTIAIGGGASANGIGSTIVGYQTVEAANSLGGQTLIGSSLQYTDTTLGLIMLGGYGYPLIIGYATKGNMLIGNSALSSAFFPANATNILQFTDGTPDTVNAPSGGGYFYSVGGVLHWVDSSNLDTTLSLAAAGQLASTTVNAYTNGAAAAAGTLTNAPVAGNPTKWIPVNDNGTIRHIPAW